MPGGRSYNVPGPAASSTYDRKFWKYTTLRDRERDSDWKLVRNIHCLRSGGTELFGSSRRLCSTAAAREQQQE